MSQPEHEAAYLIETYGCVKALEVAEDKLSEARAWLGQPASWHADAIRCYVLGFNTALGLVDSHLST